MRKTKKLINRIPGIILAVCLSAMFSLNAYGRGENDTEEAELVTSYTTEVLFEDVVGHWAELYINEVAKNKLLEGDTKGHFNPDSNISRGDFAVALWRMSGSPSVDYESTFTDISDEAEDIRSAVDWAQKNGYINGTTETSFEPESPLTREAAMKVLHLHSGDTSREFLGFSLIYNKTFTDSKDISNWATEAMHWGLYNGLLSGTSNTTLSPREMLTRAQLSKILMKYKENAR